MAYTGGGILIRCELSGLASAARRAGYPGEPGKMTLTEHEVRNPSLPAVARLGQGVEINDHLRALQVIAEPDGPDARFLREAFPECIVAAWVLEAHHSRYGFAVFEAGAVRRCKFGDHHGVRIDIGPPLPGELALAASRDDAGRYHLDAGSYTEHEVREVLVDSVMSRLTSTDFTAWRWDDTPRFHQLEPHHAIEATSGIPNALAEVVGGTLIEGQIGRYSLYAEGPPRFSEGDIVRHLVLERVDELGEPVHSADGEVVLVPARHVRDIRRARDFLLGALSALRNALPRTEADLHPADLFPVDLLDDPTVDGVGVFEHTICRRLRREEDC